MRRAAAYLGVLLGAVSCDPRKFDDLKDEAWVQIAERDDTQTDGDFGTEVIALAAPSEGGARFVIGVGNPPQPGLAQATFDSGGGLKQMIGFNADANGKGALEPLEARSTASAAGPYGTDQFLVAVKDKNTVIRYDEGLSGGVAILTTVTSAGSVASGNLGLGGTAPDVVAMGTTGITLLPDGDLTKTPITCMAKLPNASTSPPVNVNNLVVAPINAAAGHEQLVVSTTILDNSFRVIVMEPSQIQNNKLCPGMKAEAGGTCTDTPGCNDNDSCTTEQCVSGICQYRANPACATYVNMPVPAPETSHGIVSLAVGNLDATAAPEIVAGTIGGDVASGAGSVRILMNVTMDSTPTVMNLPLGTDREDEDAAEFASSASGARLLIGDVDGVAGNELLVGDPGFTSEGVSAAGQVRIYKVDSGCDATKTRGPLCLIRTLFDPDPSKNDYFGRAMTIAPFKTKSGSMTTVLAIAQKAKLWVYFRVFASQTDVRQ